MAKAPIAFRSSEGRYKFLGTTQLINAYAEKMGEDGKGVIAVLPCDGLVTFSSTGADSPCRGLIFMEDLDLLYSIHSNDVYKIISDGTSVRIGTIPSVDQVQLSRNQKAAHLPND